MVLDLSNISVRIISVISEIHCTRSPAEMILPINVVLLCVLLCAALTHARLVLQGMWPQEGVMQPLIKVPHTMHCGAVQNILEGAAGGIVSEPVVLLLCVSLVHHVSQEPIHFYSSSPDHRAADPLRKNCSSLLVWYFFFLSFF